MDYANHLVANTTFMHTQPSCFITAGQRLTVIPSKAYSQFTAYKQSADKQTRVRTPLSSL